MKVEILFPLYHCCFVKISLNYLMNIRSNSQYLLVVCHALYYMISVIFLNIHKNANVILKTFEFRFYNSKINCSSLHWLFSTCILNWCLSKSIRRSVSLMLIWINLFIPGRSEDIALVWVLMGGYRKQSYSFLPKSGCLPKTVTRTSDLSRRGICNTSRIH